VTRVREHGPTAFRGDRVRRRAGGLLAGAAYRVPETAPAAPAYNEAPDWKAAAPADATARGPWWTVFHDEPLAALEAQVADANQDLKAALARIEQARALDARCALGIFSDRLGRRQR